MNTSKKLGTLIYSNRSEGVNNPAVGGVFTSKEDPTDWFSIHSITKDDTSPLGFEARNSGGTTASYTMSYIGDHLEDYEIRYDYIDAGTLEAHEAMRNPKSRLRDILLGQLRVAGGQCKVQPRDGKCKAHCL